MTIETYCWLFAMSLIYSHCHRILRHRGNLLCQTPDENYAIYCVAAEMTRITSKTRDLPLQFKMMVEPSSTAGYYNYIAYGSLCTTKSNLVMDSDSFLLFCVWHSVCMQYSSACRSHRRQHRMLYKYLYMDTKLWSMHFQEYDDI